MFLHDAWSHKQYYKNAINRTAFGVAWGKRHKFAEKVKCDQHSKSGWSCKEVIERRDVGGNTNSTEGAPPKRSSHGWRKSRVASN